MIKYKYPIGNDTFVETLDVNSIPKGVEYKEIEYQAPPIPVVIDFETQTTLAKFRMAFRRVTGTRIETIVEQIKLLPDSDSKFDMIDLLEYSNIIERNNQTLITGAGSFGVTLEQLDEIFITAENLNY